MLDIAVARLANHWFCCGYVVRAWLPAQQNYIPIDSCTENGWQGCLSSFKIVIKDSYSLPHNQVVTSLTEAWSSILSDFRGAVEYRELQVGLTSFYLGSLLYEVVRLL